MDQDRKHRIIKGIRGSIAILMVILLTPFLTVAVSLVEMGRYSSTVSMMDEAIGVADVSTLANYDAFMQDRFGVLVIDQRIPIEQLQEDARKSISLMVEKDAELKGVTITPRYSLAQKEIASNCIFEYCVLNAPTALLNQFFDIESLISTILSGIPGFDLVSSMFSSLAGFLASQLNLIDSLINLRESSDEIENKIAAYDTAYTAFETAVNTQADYCAEYDALGDRPEIPDDATEEEIEEIEEAQEEYDEAKEALESSMASQVEVINAAKADYLTAISNLKTALNNLNSSYNAVKEANDSCSTAAFGLGDTIMTNITEMQKKQVDTIDDAIKKKKQTAGFSENDEDYKELLKQKRELEEGLIDDTLGSNATKIRSDAEKNKNELDNSVSMTYVQNGLSALEAIEPLVSAFDAEAVTASTSLGSSYNKKIGDVSVLTIIKQIATDMYNSLVSGEFKKFVESIQVAMEELFRVTLFFDSKQSSVIDTDFYTDLGGLPGGEAESPVTEMLENMVDILNDYNTVVAFVTPDAISVIPVIGEVHKLNELKDAIGAVVDLVDKVSALFDNMKTFGNDLIDAFSEMNDLEKWNICVYSAYNNPCRTDYSANKNTFTTFSGTSPATSTEVKNNNSWLNPQFDAEGFKEIANKLKNFDYNGNDIAFTCSEVEYIISGSKNELENQLSVFFQLYFVRFVLDIVPVVINKEIQSIGAATTIGYPVVLILSLIVEPFLDMLMLVNGGDVGLFHSAYLAPSNLPEYIADLCSVVVNTDAFSDAVGDNLLNAVGADKEKYEKTLAEKNKNKKEPNGGKKKGFKKWLSGLIEFSYRDYCFLMLVTIPKEDQVARIQNIMQMEGTYHYNIAAIKGESYYAGPHESSSGGYHSGGGVSRGDSESYFRLSEAYTYVETTAEADIKQMLPSLIDSTHFSVKRTVGRGY